MIILLLFAYAVYILHFNNFHEISINKSSYASIISTSLQLPLSSEFCIDWNDETADEWWSNNPTYIVTSETKTHFCFSKMQNEEKIHFFQSLHDIQYNTSNCHNTITQYMWSSGLGADISNVNLGLVMSQRLHRPFQVTLKEGNLWHYAAFKEEYRKGRDPVCPTADMFCYFLPLGICPAGKVETKVPDFGYVSNEDLFDPWLREYSMRPQRWLRKRIFDNIHNDNAITSMPTSEQQCAVIHIRRTDVVLHGSLSRKYYPVEAYLTKLQKSFPTVKNILLFTDDANAIEEATDLHPDYHWMYFQKKRHRGSEGGWENQIPSDDPADEFISMLSEFELAKSCDILVYTTSGFANIIQSSMKATGKFVHLLQLDDERYAESSKNRDSEKELNKLLLAKRKQEREK